MRALVMTCLLCYGALEIVRVLLLLLLLTEEKWEKEHDISDDDSD